MDLADREFALAEYLQHRLADHAGGANDGYVVGLAHWFIRGGWPLL